MADEILQFDSVTLAATDAYDDRVAGIHFTLCAGESLLVQVEDERGCPPLADTAEGLCEPETGRVLIDGADWAGMAGDEVAQRRSRIGRVFASHAWLSNLDVDENVTLAQRHHSRRPESEIRDEALRLARRFRRDGLPAMRPAWASRHELIVAQWVRALLGEPRLVILERPTREVRDDECAQLVETVQACRDRGAALVWITGDRRLLNNQSLDATFRVKVSGDRWEMLE